MLDRPYDAAVRMMILVLAFASACVVDDEINRQVDAEPRFSLDCDDAARTYLPRGGLGSCTIAWPIGADYIPGKVTHITANLWRIDDLYQGLDAEFPDGPPVGTWYGSSIDRRCYFAACLDSNAL